MSKRLIIFVKNPALGKVKTRLAAEIGELQALNTYLVLLSHTQKVAEKLDAVSIYIFHDGETGPTLSWPRNSVHKVQQGKDLGEKMANAFHEIEAPGGKMIIIGSDCPEINSEDIEMAFDLLDSNDVVLGPAIDGGYYLLGLRKVYTNLFEDICWSTDQVANQTITKCESTGLSLAKLHTLRDIDTVEDLNYFIQKGYSF